MINLRGRRLLSGRVGRPDDGEHQGHSPAEPQVQLVVRVRPEDHHRNEIVQEQALDKHPHEHRGPGVLEHNVEPLADARLDR